MLTWRRTVVPVCSRSARLLRSKEEISGKSLVAAGLLQGRDGLLASKAERHDPCNGIVGDLDAPAGSCGRGRGCGGGGGGGVHGCAARVDGRIRRVLAESVDVGLGKEGHFGVADAEDVGTEVDAKIYDIKSREVDGLVASGKQTAQLVDGFEETLTTTVTFRLPAESFAATRANWNEDRDVDVVYAYGLSDTLSQHAGNSRGTGTINFVTGESSTSASWRSPWSA